MDDESFLKYNCGGPDIPSQYINLHKMMVHLKNLHKMMVHLKNLHKMMGGLCC